jgi:serine/threonine-protein kinase
MIYGIGVAGVVLLVVIWRGALVRNKALTMRQLYWIDAFYAASSGLTFACATVLAYDLQMAMTANILWSCLVVFLRTIVVPSTGSRTAIFAVILLTPMVAASAILPFLTKTEFPLSALVGSTLLVAVVVVILANVGSRIIYDLRTQVSAAKRLGSYALGEKIGEGGNGAVYRAHHELLRRPAAIKLIRPERVDAETLDRFEREVQAMSQLTHPNTVAVFDYGRDPNGIFYYAMEFLDGIDLEKLVRAYGPQPGDRAISILVQACGALQEAHNRGMVHRDIKPANIILCVRGDVPDVAKVVDFGLVKEITADRGDPNQTGRIFGTPAFLAPECMTDPEALGPATDLYGLGAVGYFLVTGKFVFEGKNALDICLKHVTTTPRAPTEIVPGLAPELEAILLRCLAKNPKDRPASAGELATMLRAVPSTSSWSDADAQKWWRERKDGPVSSESKTQTLTITVDLGAREPANDEIPRVSRRA